MSGARNNVKTKRETRLQSRPPESMRAFCCLPLLLCGFRSPPTLAQNSTSASVPGFPTDQDYIALADNATKELTQLLSGDLEKDWPELERQNDGLTIRERESPFADAKEKAILALATVPVSPPRKKSPRPGRAREGAPADAAHQPLPPAVGQRPARGPQGRQDGQQQRG